MTAAQAAVQSNYRSRVRKSAKIATNSPRTRRAIKPGRQIATFGPEFSRRSPHGSHYGSPQAAAVSLTVNGKAVNADVDPRTLLVQLLRENLRLTGTHVGCDTSQCGACVVHVNGKAIKSCTMLALQAEGADVLTIEGLAAADGPLHPMQEAFRENHGLQCGFCTPGMIMTAVDMVHRMGNELDERTIREELEGNICRCTGYHNIVKAIAAGAKAMSGGGAIRTRQPSSKLPTAAIVPEEAHHEEAAMSATGIGAAVRRKEDLRFITGKGQYTDDINRPGQAYIHFVRSPHAHARIKSIDAKRRRRHAGRARGAHRRASSPPTRSAI